MTDIKLIAEIVLPYIFFYFISQYVDYSPYTSLSKNNPFLNVPAFFRIILFPINSKKKSHSVISILLSGTSVLFVLYTILGVIVIRSFMQNYMQIHLLICAILASLLFAVDGIILALLYTVTSDYTRIKKWCISILLVLVLIFLIWSSIP